MATTKTTTTATVDLVRADEPFGVAERPTILAVWAGRSATYRRIGNATEVLTARYAARMLSMVPPRQRCPRCDLEPPRR